MLQRLLLLASPLILACSTASEARPADPAAGGAEAPNVVYVMSDELAYFELGHMGNPYIRTPNVDRFAAEGMRFTHAYAGSPVCAPLRCNLMTGMHAGHASVRANDGGTPLRAGEPTIASMLKDKGYATGGFGKWGCGGRDSTGVPEEHGFDTFFGYYDQVHAHSFYPPYLVRNSEEVPLAGNVGGRTGETYSHYEIMDAGLDFIRENKDRPFFCYLPITPPHGMYDIPADDPVWALYADDEWMKRDDVKQDVKNYAAMVSLVDRNLGQVLELLDELGLDDNTVVFFTGDNGGQDRFRSPDHPRGFFGPNVDPRTGVEFRGGKGNLFEGGLRIPSMARWPGHIPAGTVSDLVFYQPDVLPTIAALTGATSPEGIDGMSIAPTLLASGDQPEHDFLYWEFGSQLAVRMGDWKGLLSRKGGGGWDEVLASGTGTWTLYDLAGDVSEEHDLAAEHPERIAAMAAIAAREFTPARPGTYHDPARTRHEKDRDAKWGTSPDRPAPRRPKGKPNRLKGKDLLPAADMTVVSFSSQNEANGKLAARAIDGDPTTIWHTRFSDVLAKHPHELVLDLGAVRAVTGLRYLARQDGGWNGAFAETELYLSTDPERFPEAPAATTTFKRLRKSQALDLPAPVPARYVRVRVLSENKGGPWASAAEIGVTVSDR